MKVILDIWRQKSAADSGRFVRYQVPEVNPHMSFLEMLDVLNQQLVARGEEPVAFESDCREGICGTCGFIINGSAHGPVHGSTVCQLYMRSFQDGDVLRLEPWRAKAFPVVRDLVVDRSAFDRIIMAGGFISTHTGSAPEANSVPISKSAAERSMEAAACIGCGACVASCPNASASLFVSAKIAHLGLLPQGQPERLERALGMIQQTQREGFGHCSVAGECEAICPAHVKLEVIALANADFVRGIFKHREPTAVDSAG